MIHMEGYGYLGSTRPEIALLTQTADFYKGLEVTIVDLASEQDCLELLVNGKRATIQKWLPESGEWECALDINGAKRALKPENLDAGTRKAMGVKGLKLLSPEEE